MRHRSPSYSPPRRSSRGRRRSPSPRGRSARREELPTSLLVRNVARICRADDLRLPFEQYGVVRDVYLPKDFHTGEPRGFGFVQFLDPSDAAEAQYHLDRQLIFGREVSVVFAEENRKKPQEMRSKERVRGRPGYGGRHRSSHHDSRSRSPRDYSPSPKRGRHSNSYSPADRGHRRSFTPSPVRRRDFHSRSPSPVRNHSRREQVRSPPPARRSPPPVRRRSRDVRPSSYSKGRRASRSPSRSPPPQQNSRAYPRSSPPHSRRQRSPTPVGRTPSRTPEIPRARQGEVHVEGSPIQDNWRARTSGEGFNSPPRSA